MYLTRIILCVGLLSKMSAGLVHVNDMKRFDELVAAGEESRVANLFLMRTNS
jgi:hypothetical protein